MATGFDAKFIEKQKNRLLQIKNELINNMNNHRHEAIYADKDQIVEDGDQAQQYLDESLSFGLRQRDVMRLREIDAALERIEDGSYGYCEETDEPISKKRLEKMPWTRLSIDAAEELKRDNASHRQVG